MNLNNDPRTSSFVTNVGLITTNGPYGYNIMACEWTHQISHDPALIALAIRNYKATYLNILETKEFGVNIASSTHNVLSSISGDNTGKKTDKIEALKELGFEFYKAETIDVYMVKGACMNAECKLVKHVDIGDHPLLIGEIVSIKAEDTEPLLYHKSKYWHIGDRIEKPEQSVLDTISSVVEKHTKKT